MILIYGANGFTGRLVAAEAIRQGLVIIVAGRSENIDDLGRELGVPSRCFSVDELYRETGALRNVRVVVNCAGPFAVTARPLAEACVRRGIHYLDLAGETPEHQALLDFDQLAIQNNSLVIPGVGFGIAPTDCAAAMASRLLPAADRLIIGYDTRGDPSRGTMETVMPLLSHPGVQRKDGRLVASNARDGTYVFQNGRDRTKTWRNPWRADIVAAFRSTGIPNIETFATFPLAARILFYIGNSSVGKAIMRQALKSAPAGPSGAARQNGSTVIWAVVKRKHQTAQVTIHGPDPYDFTARIAVACAKLASRSAAAGFQTPTTAFGSDFIQSIEGVRVDYSQA